MKKLVLSLLLVGSISGMYAQKANVSKAKNKVLMETPDFAGARELIKPALEEETTKNQANTWYVAGLIGYKEKGKMETDNILDPTKIDQNAKGAAVMESYAYLVKADSLDQLPNEKGKVKPRFRKDIKRMMREYYNFDLIGYGAALFDVALTGEYGRNVGMDSTPFTDPFKADANAPVYLVEGSWTPENPNAEYPRLSVNRSTGGDNSLASTFWYRDGKYIRLKTAQIGYTFPQKWMKAIGVQQLRVFVEGGNLFTLSGLPEGIDPESPGVNIGYYPQQRTVMGGLSITF